MESYSQQLVWGGLGQRIPLLSPVSGAARIWCNIGFALFHRTNHCLGCVGARPFWGRGVYFLVISNINIGFQKSLTPPLSELK